MLYAVLSIYGGDKGTVMIYTEDRDYWKAQGFYKHIKLLRKTYDTLPTVHLTISGDI